MINNMRGMLAYGIMEYARMGERGVEIRLLPWDWMKCTTAATLMISHTYWCVKHCSSGAAVVELFAIIAVCDLLVHFKLLKLSVVFTLARD
jgi:hypothetical protein